MSTQVDPDVKVMSAKDTAEAQAQFEAFVVPEGAEKDDESVKEEQPYAAPKAKHVVEHEEGVYVGGEWWTPGNGCSFAVRQYIRALEVGGKFAVRVDPAPKIDEEMLEWSPVAMANCGQLRTTRMKREIVRINFVVPHQHLERSMYPAICNVDREMRLRYEAIHHRFITFVWLERDRLSFREADLLKQCGQVWVACRSNFEAVVRSGVPAEKVRVVPHPYDPNHVFARYRKPKRDPKAPYVFYSIGKWEPRKNQPALLEAFMLAFHPGQNVCLQMKTSGFGAWDGFPSNFSQCMTTLLEKPLVKARGWNAQNVQGHIRCVSSHLTEAQLMQYHLAGDCHVSSSHGEAWDLPAWDAFLIGNGIVNATAMGHEEYDDVARGAGFEDVHPQYGWVEGARWETVSVRNLAAQLETVFECRDGQFYPEDDRAETLRKLTYENMGAAMRAYIREVEDAAKVIEGASCG